jgi:hypothetical protein
MIKKIIIGLLLIIIIPAVVIITVPFIAHLYLHYFSFSEANQDILASTNNAVQIGYNIAYLIIAIIVLLVAYNQLSKTREATTIQTLINLDYYIRSDEFLKKRKKLADIILTNELENLKDWLGKFHPRKKLTDEEMESIAIVKNIFESVIYQFELIGHFYKKRVFTIEDVYQLFSIEIQNYWVLMTETGYIKYLREHESEDFYDKFQDLFNDTLKQELINESPNLLFKYFSKLYYWTGLYTIFYQRDFYLLLKTHNKMSCLIDDIKAKTQLFLIEEKNLID